MVSYQTYIYKFCLHCGKSFFFHLQTMAFRMDLLLTFILIWILMQYRAYSRTLEEVEVIQTLTILTREQRLVELAHKKTDIGSMNEIS